MPGDPYPGRIRYMGDTPVKMTYAEAVASVALAGWPESEWDRAVAVGAAESDLIINVYNTYKEGHYGWFQISKSAHPGFFSKKDLWVSPIDNAKEALRIRNSQGWRAWEAYTNGRYTGNLLQAKAAVAAVKAGRAQSMKSRNDFYVSVFREELLFYAGIFSGEAGRAIDRGLGGITGGAEGIGEAIEVSGAAVVDTARSMTAGLDLVLGAARWMSSGRNWGRVAAVVLGGGLALAGVAIVARPAAQQVRKEMPI